MQLSLADTQPGQDPPSSLRKLTRNKSRHLWNFSFYYYSLSLTTFPRPPEDDTEQNRTKAAARLLNAVTTATSTRPPALTVTEVMQSQNPLCHAPSENYELVHSLPEVRLKTIVGRASLRTPRLIVAKYREPSLASSSSCGILKCVCVWGWLCEGVCTYTFRIILLSIYLFIPVYSSIYTLTLDWGYDAANS